MREFTATFIGHRRFYGIETQKIEAQIRRLINNGYTHFLCGGMGEFDLVCTNAVKKLKKQFPNIELCIVIPYLTFNSSNFDYYDEIIYPEGLENYYFKSAIVKRNRYIVDNSSSAICYINHITNGAGKTFEYAKKCGLSLINLGELEQKGSPQ